MNDRALPFSCNPWLLTLAFYLMLIVIASIGLAILPDGTGKLTIVGLCAAIGLVHTVGFPAADTL